MESTSFITLIGFGANLIVVLPKFEMSRLLETSLAVVSKPAPTAPMVLLTLSPSSS